MKKGDMKMEQYKDLIFNTNKKIDKMIMEMLVIQEILNTKVNELTQEEKYFLETEKKELMNNFKIEFRKNNLKEIKKYNKLKECNEQNFSIVKNIKKIYNIINLKGNCIK